MNKNYFQQSRTLLYSYLISLPLLILYEILIQISQPNAEYMVRISVDAWFRQMFSTFGFNALNATFYIAAITGLWILWQDRKKLRSIRLSTFLFMLLEALLYAIGLALVISLVLESLLMQVGPAGQTKLQLLALSLGAGLYEELFFRVILVSLLVWAFAKIFSRRWIASWTAVLIAAVCFSLAHYLGVYGDPFTLNSFLFRFLFGLALNFIYLYRGFGMAAWTHAIYDLLVVLF